MKKFLCTASLLLAFSMGSFANTNEAKYVSALEAKTVNTVDKTLSVDNCNTVELKFFTATGNETSTWAEITLTLHVVLVTVCDDGSVSITKK